MMTRLSLMSAAFIVLLQPSHVLAQAAEPAREFLEGNRTTFSTKGHPKAKGVNFTIVYPKSWAAEEGERPNVVQKFVSEGGHGREMATILTKELPLPPGTVVTNEDMKELFAPSELRGMLPDGAVFVDARSTEIEATPAGILEYTIRVDRAGVTALLHAWSLVFLSGSTIVQVQFTVGGPAGAERDAARRMATFKPLFTLMANSIVIPDKWTGAAGAPVAGLATRQTSSSLPYDSPPLLILTLLLSFIVTWGIGLAPPLLIRYVFVRHPLSKKAASWVAAGFSVFYWMAFGVIKSALGEKPGTGAVWIIMFLVARWIMSRGYALRPQPPMQVQQAKG